MPRGANTARPANASVEPLHLIFRFIVLIVLLTAFAASAQVPLPPDESRMRGERVPDVTLIGEDSTTFTLAALAGKPVLVSPMFTSCPTACPMMTENLRDALKDIGEPGVGYHVLSISFDPADGPAAMRAYRKKMALPDGWTLAVATPENRKALLDAIDFHYQPVPDGGFAHPNVVAILTPVLAVSSYAHGLTYESADLRRRFEVATQDASFARHYRPYIIGIALVAWASVMAALYATRKKRASQAA
jgi:cytochrome oxidase Cu insertion factor (SCO1/SenC/PrrC family)